MKTTKLIPAFLFLCGAAIGIFVYREFRKPLEKSPEQLTLEQVLYIKELHLVKHTYNDLFFLHKKNDKNKAIRAMVQVPVTVTAYINLKEIRLVKQNDSIRQVILPHAYLDEPRYLVDSMVVRETRSFQIHAGKDMYPQVAGYMQALVAERIQTVRTMAISNQILVQAEAEGMHYIKSVLATLGRQDIEVTFGDAAKDAEVKAFEKTTYQNLQTTTKASTDHLAFGYIGF